jgi:flagellin
MEVDFMVVQHNMTALNANRMLGVVNSQQSKSTEKLSSGYKINRAGDNAAGLAISEKMRGQIRGLTQASANAQDGISLIQTAEGALTETHSLIQRMRELAVQAASDTNTNDDRTQIQGEIDQLTREVDRIANTTEFNTKKLLDGSVEGAKEVKKSTVKVEGDFANSTVGISFVDMSNAEKISYTEVVRIELKEDVTDADSFNGDTKVEKTFLFDKDSNKGENKINISAAVETGTSLKVLIGSEGAYAKIDNYTSLKAGDVITITVGGGINTAAAADPGKESLRLQIGANAGQELALGIASMKAKDLNISQQTGDTGKALKVTDQKSASLAINAYDLALQKVSTERSKMGAIQNRLEHTISNLDTSSENLQTAESRIRDTDMAAEMVNFSKNSIIQQAAQSMLAQANQANQGVLSLLR